MTVRVTITHDEPLNPREIYVGEPQGHKIVWQKLEPGTSISMYVYHAKDVVISERTPENAV